MLLKFDLVDPEGQPLEQTMFTQLKLLDRIPDKALEAGISGDGYTWHGDVRREAAATITVDKSDWSLGWVPAGIILMHHKRHQIPGKSGEAEHMVYSDGLATVSVYFEKVTAGKEILRGISRMGAVNAMGGVINGHHATVVGEVPAVTVEQIAKSIHSQ